MDRIFIRNREVATKEYVDTVAGGGSSVDLSNYYTKAEVDAAIAAALAEIQADLDVAKANLATLTNLEAGE